MAPETNPYECPVADDDAPSTLAADDVLCSGRLRKLARAFGVLGLLCPGTWMAALVAIISLQLVVWSLAEFNLTQLVYAMALFAISVAQLSAIAFLLLGTCWTRLTPLRICTTSMITLHTVLLGMLLSNLLGSSAPYDDDEIALFMIVFALVLNLILFGILRLSIESIARPFKNADHDG